MTRKELQKKFPFAGKDGVCATCEYVASCQNILPGFHKPGKCGGPFYRNKE